jgi:hypothetical protein
MDIYMQHPAMDLREGPYQTHGWIVIVCSA